MVSWGAVVVVSFGRVTMSCGDSPSSLFDDTWYLFIWRRTCSCVVVVFLFETHSGRRALPSSRFSATSSVFLDISLVVVLEVEPHPQLVAEMLFIPCVSLVVFQGFSEVFLKFPPSVSQVLLRLFLGLSLVVPRCFPGSTQVFPRLPSGVPQVFPKCFPMCRPRLFPSFYKVFLLSFVPTFPKCFPGFSQVFPCWFP